MLHYTYTATGQKISQQLEDDGRLGTRREYAGPFVYVNSTLGWLNTPYGRIVALPRGGFHKELHLRDHTSTSLSTGLGNTRMVLEEIDSKYEVVQEAAYYPFGMAIPSQSFALPNENDTYQNRYLYNGKEYQDDFELNWYDYGARFYDAQIGRFHSVDPLTEKNHRNTPYSYAANNPIKYIDWLGLDTILVDRKGRFSETVLPDNENDHDVIVRVSARDRRRGRINYRRDGTLRRKHKSFKTEKDAFTINTKGARGPNEEIIEGARLSNFDSPEAAWAIFEELVRITSVEWSYVAMFDDDFDVHINMFTSHSNTTETFGASMTFLWHSDENSPFTVFSHIHNHPGTARDVLLPSPSNPGQPSDIDFRNKLLQHGPLLFGIYNRGVVRGYEFD